MLMIIQIGLGVAVGLLLASVITCAIMFNPKFMVWITDKYLKHMDEVAKSLTKREEEL